MEGVETHSLPSMALFLWLHLLPTPSMSILPIILARLFYGSHRLRQLFKTKHTGTAHLNSYYLKQASVHASQNSKYLLNNHCMLITCDTFAVDCLFGTQEAFSRKNIGILGFRFPGLSAKAD